MCNVAFLGNIPGYTVHPFVKCFSSIFLLLRIWMVKMATVINCYTITDRVIQYIHNTKICFRA